MESILFFIGSLLTLGISFILFKKAAGSLSLLKPNMISYIFYFNLILEMYFASILVVLGIDDHYMFTNISTNTRVQGWLVINYTLLAMPIGMLLSKRLLLGKRPMRLILEEYVSKPIDLSYLGKGLKYTIWLVTIVSIVACLYTFFKIGYIPVLKVLQGGDLATLRIFVSRGFQGNEYIKNLLALGLMPILSYAWGGYYLRNKSISDFIMFITTIVFSINILYYNFAKSPVLWYILSYIFFYYYAIGEIKKKYVFFVIFLVFIFLVFFYSRSGVGIQEFLSYNSGPVGRIILSQSGGLYTMLQIFPDIYDHLGFSSISRALSNLFDLDYSERAARIAMVDFNPRGVEAGTAGVMNSLFVGEAWANFGAFGVLLAPFWVGFCIHFLYGIFLKMNKNPLYFAFFVAFSFGGSITGGFNDYLYNPGVAVYFFLIILGAVEHS